MPEVKLNSGEVALVDEIDLELVEQYKWYALRKGGKIYACAAKPKWMQMHRLILQPKSGQEVDHRNGNTLDNRRSNIRIATRGQNMANRVYPNRTGYKGVSQVASGRYVAIAQLKYIGTYDTAEEAAKAYDKRAYEIWEEFAYLNFPDSVKAGN